VFPPCFLYRDALSITVLTIDIQVKAAQAGVGVALLPEFAARESCSLIELPASPSIKVDIWMGVHEDLGRSPAIQAPMAFIENCFSPSSSGLTLGINPHGGGKNG
jgi:DNA-binding transcriptional LysR family regulator